MSEGCIDIDLPEAKLEVPLEDLDSPTPAITCTKVSQVGHRWTAHSTRRALWSLSCASTFRHMPVLLLVVESGPWRCAIC
jgi:hypothetical protein